MSSSYSKLQYIIAIADKKSISQAARDLYISQPALTKYISTLEDELGVQLFDRTSTPIQLTYAGEVYLEYAKLQSGMEKKMRAEMEEISKMKRGRIHLAIGIGQGEYWLPQILPVFSRLYPGIEVHIYDGFQQDYEEMLARGNIDIAISSWTSRSDKFQYEEICEENILLYMSPEDPILKNIDVSGNDADHPVYIRPELLNGATIIMTKPVNSTSRTVAQILTLCDIKAGKRMYVGSCNTAYSLAAEGMGVAFFPRSSYFFPGYHKKPVCCTVTDPPCRRKIVAAYRKEDLLSNIKKSFIEVVKQVVIENRLY